MNEKKPEEGPKVNRDENNRLIHDHAEEILKNLHKKLITEERDFQKEISFKNAKGNKRDVMLYITIAQRNSVNGKIVLSDPVRPKQYEKWSDEDPYAYKVFEYIECEMLAREIPMSMSTAGKFLLGCFAAVKGYLARMNVIDRI